MAAGVTDHVWTLQEGLLSRVPPWPQPQTFHGLKADDNAPKDFWRYLVTLDLPVGEEARKAAAIPVKATEK